ncbi:protease [Streptomyces nojiriensis]|uniref:Protease n=1 Tax=Streptomyces nojiriensis TaxID=66374 RepID=A0ABQ3SZQ9_9ACTN|nr:alpha/beta hydrolase [Streptomyces nojiriensis]QTI47138.1 Carboxylesterase B [Streptomyces nojiriensis]GGR80708.1 protease [Streptomyces nojiriensis]GHI73630.1 protease [Streptomyces nojiriensis]
MHRSRVRRVIAGGTAVGAMLLASLGAAPTPTPASAPAPTPASTSSAPAGGDDPLARFHDQRLRWGDCPEKPVPAEMRCTVVEVPLDYAAPGKGTVKLALGRLPATDPDRRIGSILINFGGPGAPGLAGLAADPKTFADLGERYDLIGFDPRGVGHSDPVSCGAGDTVGDPSADTAAALSALRDEVKRCEINSGPVLAHMGTMDVARDMDVMRRLLGDEKLNFLGFSYGSRLGAVYAALFPRDTGRMVLDGVDTLTEPLMEQALVSARGQQRALDNFLTWCAHQNDCVYGTNTRTAREKVAALVERTDTQPLVGDDGTEVSGPIIVLAIGQALYSPLAWPALAKALAQAERERDPAGMLALLGLGAEPTDPTAPPDPTDPAQAGGSDPVPADNLAAALAAVTCADDPDRSIEKATPAALEKEIEERAEEFLKVSEVFGVPQLLSVLTCYGRPAGTDFIQKIHHPGAPPMLLIGTRGDPATPYEWTEETAERLGSAVIVDHKGDGHTGYSTSRCVQEYADDFLIYGRLPSGTRSCPAGE